MTSSTQQHPQQQEPFLHIPYFKDCGNFTTFWVSWKVDRHSVNNDCSTSSSRFICQARNIIIIIVLRLFFVHHHRHLRSMRQHYLSHPSRLRCVHEMSMSRLQLRHCRHCINRVCRARQHYDENEEYNNKHDGSYNSSMEAVWESISIVCNSIRQCPFEDSTRSATAERGRQE
jgi:hypothetical protein